MVINNLTRPWEKNLDSLLKKEVQNHSGRRSVVVFLARCFFLESSESADSATRTTLTLNKAPVVAENETPVQSVLANCKSHPCGLKTALKAKILRHGIATEYWTFNSVLREFRGKENC